MAEKALSKNQLIAELSRSAHGDLKQYLPIVKGAAKNDSEFLAHLIAWNENKGQIRDSKVALPVATLNVWHDKDELVENSLAHMAKLDPRNLVKAVRFGKDIKLKGNGRTVTRLVEAYLREREKKRGWWDATALQHRTSVKTLYALCHIKPSTRANKILFEKDYPKNSAFYWVSQLRNLTPKDAADAIINKDIPFQIAIGALGGKAKDPDVVLALIEAMSPTQLTNSVKMLEKMGLNTNPALKAAFELGLQKVASSKKTTFKASRAIEALDDDSPVKEKLKRTQEKQIDALDKIKGRWLVLGDKSGSMHSAIEASRQIAATLSRMVEDDVWLVFFDTTPAKVINAKGKTYEELVEETKRVSANGGTSIGCGLQYILDKGIEVDGIAVVSDGGENAHPVFSSVYKRYTDMVGKDIPVYFYDLEGEPDRYFLENLKQFGIDVQVFDIRKTKVDYYSLPNLIQTMRTNRYGLIDEIMETRLLRVKDVLPNAQWV